MALKIEKFQSPGKGNGLRASMLLSPGDLLYIAEPFTYTVIPASWGNVCEFCLRTSPHLRQCASCNFAKYCSKRCQTEAWPDHKRECKCLKSIECKEEIHLMRFAGKAIFKLLKKKPCPSEDLYSVSELVSNFNNQNMERKIQCLHLTDMLRQYLKEEIPLLYQFPSDLNLPEHFAKLFCNQMKILSDRLEEIGVGLYPSISLLNHSCDPNCIAISKGKNFHIRAIKEIQVGEELTISYSHPLQPTCERQHWLRYTYCFECDCNRCQTRDKDEHMLAGDKQASDETKDFLSRVEDLQIRKKWLESLVLCDAQLKKNIDRLPDKNVYQLRLLYLAMCACQYLLKFREWLQYGIRTLRPYRLYITGYSIHLALRLQTVANLQVNMGYKREGLKNLRDALGMMKVVLGEDDTETQDVIEAIELYQLTA